VGLEKGAAMSFTVTDTKKFAAILTALNTITKEVVFRVSNGHLKIMALSETTFYGLAVDLPVDGAVTVEAFGVKTEDLAKAVKSLGASAVFSLDANKLTIVSGNKKYHLAIYETTYVKEMPRIIPPGAIKLRLAAKDLEAAIKEASTFTESLKFRAGEMGLYVIGEEKGIMNSALVSLSTEKLPEANGTYNAAFIKGVLGLSKEFKDVHLSYNTNYPLTLLYEQDGVFVQFTLAALAEVDS
jgi:hypothetical protein